MHHDLYQRFRLVMWWCGDAFLASLGSWTAHHLVATAYSSTADAHPFMTTVTPSPDACFKEDNMSYNKAQIISKWFPKHDNEITVHKWAPQSPNLNLREWIGPGIWFNGRFTSWTCSLHICSNIHIFTTKIKLVWWSLAVASLKGHLDTYSTLPPFLIYARFSVISEFS